MRFAVSLTDGVALRGLVVRPADVRQIQLLKTIAHQLIDHPDET